MYLVPKLPTFSMRKKIESEQLAKRVSTFFNNQGGHVKKQTVAHFKRERTIYNIISKYATYNTTEIRPKSGRPRKISDQKLRSLVKCFEDRVGVSQWRLDPRFNVNQSTISRNLKVRMSVRVYTEKKIRIIINFSRVDQSATYHIPLFPFLKA